MKNQSTYKKLVAEIDEAEKNNQLSTFVTYEECLKLPYLYDVLWIFSPILRKFSLTCSLVGKL